MDEFLLSIIIPVYNVEQYVEKCIQSVLSQNFSSEQYEIIIINDGSTDNSLNIVDPYGDQYTNIKVITQENQGLSGARNTGLLHAGGKYVWFVDSDDWIAEKCLKEIITYMEDLELDLLLLNKIHVDEQNKILFQTNYESSSILSGIEMYNDLGLSWNVCRYILKRKLLQDNAISFLSGILFEDGIYLDMVFYYAQRVGIFKQPVYYYLQRTGSISTQPAPQTLLRRQNSFYMLALTALQFYYSVENITYKKALKKKIISYLCQFLNYQTYTRQKDFYEKLKKITPIRHEKENMDYWFRIFMINRFPYIYAWIMRMKGLIGK